jgi:hypothetical protein
MVVTMLVHAVLQSARPWNKLREPPLPTSHNLYAVMPIDVIVYLSIHLLCDEENIVGVIQCIFYRDERVCDGRSGMAISVRAFESCSKRRASPKPCAHDRPALLTFHGFARCFF